MLFGGKRGRAVFHAREVDHPDVFMRIADAVNIEKSRRDQRARTGLGRRWTLAHEFDLEPALFARLAQRGLLRILVKLDVAPDRKPFVQLLVMDHEHLRVMHDENRNREIDEFVKVWHCGREKIIQTAVSQRS